MMSSSAAVRLLVTVLVSTILIILVTNNHNNNNNTTNDLLLNIRGGASLLDSSTSLYEESVVGVRSDEESSSRVLNVHIVPHSHDDVGWLKTPEQYYYGLNSTIRHATVYSIYDTVLLYALPADRRRTFTIVEIWFFKKWWDDQTEEVQNHVKSLVHETKQVSFVNGGWVMHDEASTHFMGMIDQTTLGHTFLKEQLNYVPTVGWQIDPFGHSATQASLMSYHMGFDSLFFGRIDYQDLEKRRKERRCEGLWDPSIAEGYDSGNDEAIFWGLTGSYGGNYGPPSGFCFDIHCDDDPLVADPRSPAFNLDRKVAEFIGYIERQGNETLGDHIRIDMGEDFQYENAHENFKNLDLLIDTVNMKSDEGSLELNGRYDEISIFYSNLENYTKAKYNEVRRTEWWEVKTDDFFPYSDCKHCFWTGYFTSRPALKRFERFGSSFLHTARIIETIGTLFKQNYGLLNSYLEGFGSLYKLDDALGIVQHHDGVSGTSKQHVAYDYAKKINDGMQIAIKHTNKNIRRLIGNTKQHFHMQYCPALNVSVCEVTQEAFEMGGDIYLFAMNALAFERSAIIGVPVSSDSTYKVSSMNSGDEVDCMLFPALNGDSKDSAPFTLFFETEQLPPVGGILYQIEKIDETSSIAKGISLEEYDGTALEVEGSKLKIKDGLNLDLDVLLEWGYYESFDSSKKYSSTSQNTDTSDKCFHNKYSRFKGSEMACLNDNSEAEQNSGAYIFRPSISNEELKVLPIDVSKSKIYESGMIVEIHTTHSSWVKQVVRLTKDVPYVEVEYLVGPIPDADNIGRELVVRYFSDIKNEQTFYTDSNGRQFMKRVLGTRPTWDFVEYEPIAGNYYPVNTAIYIEDDNESMAVLTDRSQGGTSLREGEIELMVHRRTKADDHRGVGEPLDETARINPYPPYGDAKRMGDGIVIAGNHRVVFGKGKTGAGISRWYMDDMFSPIQPFFAAVPVGAPNPFSITSLSAIRSALPRNIMLLTFMVLNPNEGRFLVRLSHQYGQNEDQNFSKPAKIDLSILFPDHKILSVKETSLSNNQLLEILNKKRMKWSKNISDRDFNIYSHAADFQYTLHPLQIRTFEISVELKESSVYSEK